MLRLLLPVVKLLLALTVFYFSYAMRFPVILYLGFGWCGWLWFVVHGWWERLIATLGFGLIALAWWAHLREDVFMLCGAASHTNEQGNYWAHMAGVSALECFALAGAGIMLLTYADYRRMSKPKQSPVLIDGGRADQSHVWPPAPKQPH